MDHFCYPILFGFRELLAAHVDVCRSSGTVARYWDGEVVQQGTGQDIVMNLADDYIASFVREVNRARVINVETVANALGASACDWHQPFTGG